MVERAEEQEMKWNKKFLLAIWIWPFVSCGVGSSSDCTGECAMGNAAGFFVGLLVSLLVTAIVLIPGKKK
jgi:hypothetical protein